MNRGLLQGLNHWAKVIIRGEGRVVVIHKPSTQILLQDWGLAEGTSSSTGLLGSKQVRKPSKL